MFVVSVCLFMVVFILVELLLSELLSVWGLTVSSWTLINIKFVSSPSQCLFMVMLVLVFITIMLYSVYYLGEENNYLYYSWMMSAFMMSMAFLLTFSSVVLLLVSWDLLGVTSFLLVHFNKNWESTNSALNTVMSNRVGDLFLFIGVLMWVPFVSTSAGVGGFNSVFGLAVIGAAMTKSAQFPFSGWLPKAIAAPTPTSALVHSSTLVTAGLLVIIKFVVPVMTKELMSVMLWVGLLTMTIAGLAALVEEDVKKVVALSTLSQIGLSMSTIGVGYHWLAYLHLISHGFFKSLLFLQIGYMMHLMISLQDPRMFMAVGKSHWYLQVQLKISLLTLCGQVFTNGMVTKEAILGLYVDGTVSILTVFLFILSLMMTFLYSYRLWVSLFKGGSVVVFVGQSSFIVKIVSVCLTFLSVSYIWWLSLNVLIVPSVFAQEGVWVAIALVVVISGVYGFTKSYKHGLLISKFTSDSVLYSVLSLLIPVKFIELLQYSFNSKAFISLKLVSLRLNLYMKGMSITTVVFIVLVVLLW